MATLVLTCLLAIWVGVCLSYSTQLRAIWREPVFRGPVLVLESDDWGAGPAEQAGALARLCEILARCRDETGRPAVMTLGVVLQTADRDAMRESGLTRYSVVDLGDPRMAPVLEAIRDGISANVFAPQLHGLAHYWEPSVVAAAVATPAVRAWFEGSGPGYTEALPATLQSRWIDSRSLPSRPLPAGEVTSAVEAEVAAWKRLFTDAPVVAVPTTFIWDDAVEKAYAGTGLRVLMTPGMRFGARDATGRPVPVGPPIFNGQKGCGGIMLLVRDVYFEPVFGHEPERLSRETAERSALGRPALVEIHRFNFCGPRASKAAFDTLDEALRRLRERLPAVRFVSSAELGVAIETRDWHWLERRLAPRCAVWARRALHLRGFGRAARASGLALPLRALGALA